MTREETQKLLAIIQGLWDNFDPKDKTTTINSWHLSLEECDYGAACKAVIAFSRADTKGFAPKTGQVIEWIDRLETGEEMTALEARDLVVKAMERLNPHAPEEEFNKLPYACKRLVGSPERLKELAFEEDPGAFLSWQARFQDSYAHVMEQERAVRRLPVAERARIEEQRAARWDKPEPPGIEAGRPETPKLDAEGEAYKAELKAALA